MSAAHEAGPAVYSRRAYLILKSMSVGIAHYPTLVAVNSLARRHPEWNMDEQRTWEEWEAALPQQQWEDRQ